MNESKELHSYIKSLIQKEITKLGLLQGQWHLGKIDGVINEKLLSVFVDGLSLPQTIPCNQDVQFSIGDEVWVIFINGDSKNKFVLCRRSV